MVNETNDCWNVNDHFLFNKKAAIILVIFGCFLSQPLKLLANFYVSQLIVELMQLQNLNVSKREQRNVKLLFGLYTFNLVLVYKEAKLRDLLEQQGFYVSFYLSLFVRLYIVFGFDARI